MAARQWLDGESADWTNQWSWQEPKLTFWQKFRFWLCEKLVGKDFTIRIRPVEPFPRSGDVVELTGSDANFMVASTWNSDAKP